MQIEFEIENCNILGKICSKFIFLTLFSIILLFEAKNTCFLPITVKFVAILRKIKFLKNPTWRPRRRSYCETTAAMAIVLN